MCVVAMVCHTQAYPYSNMLSDGMQYRILVYTKLVFSLSELFKEGVYN